MNKPFLTFLVFSTNGDAAPPPKSAADAPRSWTCPPTPCTPPALSPPSSGAMYCCQSPVFPSVGPPP